MSNTQPRDERYQSAEQALEEYFALREAPDGPGISFEAFAARYPDLLIELRELHGLCGEVDQVLERGQQAFASQQAEIHRMLSGLGTAGFSQRYAVESEVGKGGMGAVYRVLDRKLDRPLAMKVILGQVEASRTGKTPPLAPRQLARFLNEAKITGQLDHPGIVPVHEVGVDQEGRAYFTMKLVKGRTLGEVFDALPAGDPEWSTARFLGVIQRVCEAVAFAHDRGVIHRDLKPANVMVGDFGEVYVMDWGLARRVSDREEDAPAATAVEEELSAQLTLTLEGQLLGTPAYMSPEQASGRLCEIGPATDVYAIGAMLYQLIARHPPYCKAGEYASAAVVIARILQGDPEPLLAPETPPELIAICQKAMARDPAKRYADMNDLGAELRAFLEGRVVRAHKTGAVTELRLWVKRNRSFALALATGVAAVGFTIAAYGAVLAAKNRELLGARNAAIENERAAVAVRDALTGILEGVADNARDASLGRLVDAVDTVESDFASDPLAMASLLSKAGKIVHWLGHPHLGKRWLGRAFGIQQQELGLSSPETRETMATLEAVYSETGEWSSLLRLQEQLAEHLERAGSPELDEVELRLAATLKRLGQDHERARQIEAEIVKKLAASGRKSHVLYPRALGALAETHVLLGNPSEACEVQSECVSGWEKSSTPSVDRRTERELARIALAAIHVSLGELGTAVELEREALAALAYELPVTDERLVAARRQHVSSLSSIGYLGAAYEEQQAVIHALLRKGDVRADLLELDVDLLARLRGEEGAPPDVELLKEVVGTEARIERALVGTSFRAGHFATGLLRSDGTVHDLSEGSSRNRVVKILRGFHREACLYCIADVEALIDASDTLRELGAELVVVYPGSRDRFDAFRSSLEKLNASMGEPPADVVTTAYDPDQAFADSLGRPGIAPMTLILDRDSFVRFAYIGASLDDRPTRAMILDELFLLDQETTRGR